MVSSKKVAATIIMLLIVVAGVFAVIVWQNKKTPIIAPVVLPDWGPKISILGKSVEGRNIEAYTFGTGDIHLGFVGGIHGGYEWNSVLLAYKFIDYLKDSPNNLPKNLTITIIPSANPDGLYKVTGKEGRFTTLDITRNLVNGTGRFNNNNVDLNRNFACNWQATSTWQNKIVSAGTGAFSEPEAVAIQNYVTKDKPSAVVFFHSQSNAVYASECNLGILPKTLDIMNVYAKATGYPAVNVFNGYKITGDAEGWLASINIPAITVELSTHESIEWEKNLAGIKALFNYFSSNYPVK
jgi:predicted deacylase